jgi:hypothetical protein
VAPRAAARRGRRVRLQPGDRGVHVRVGDGQRAPAVAAAAFPADPGQEPGGGEGQLLGGVGRGTGPDGVEGGGRGEHRSGPGDFLEPQEIVLGPAARGVDHHPRLDECHRLPEGGRCLHFFPQPHREPGRGNDQGRLPGAVHLGGPVLRRLVAENYVHDRAPPRPEGGGQALGRVAPHAADGLGREERQVVGVPEEEPVDVLGPAEPGPDVPVREHLEPQV